MYILLGETPFSSSGPLYLKWCCILTVLVCESMIILLCIFQNKRNVWGCVHIGLW